jgi:hypothetical protein
MTSEQDQANPPPKRKLISRPFFTPFLASSSRFTPVHFASAERALGAATARFPAPSHQPRAAV